MFDKATNIELKRYNRNNIYKTIIEKKKISKQDIAKHLNLSIPTVSNNINELIDIGLVKEIGSFQSTGGRKAKIISCNTRAKVALGLDITRNHVNLIIADLAANVISSVRKRISFQGGEKYYNSLGNMVREMVTGMDISEEQIIGVGISLPAIVEGDGKSIRYAPLIDNQLNLYDELNPFIKYPYRFMNDANAGGFAELYCGSIKENAVYLQLSNSVGGAIIMDRKLYLGADSRAGEFGHVTLVPDGRPCYCGKKGCVDTYCSALLLANLTDGNLETFFEKLEAGEKECKKVWKEYIHYLSIVINNLQVNYDCDVVLGGYVGWQLEPYLEQLRDVVIERCNFETDGSYLKVSRLNAQASALGAALSYISEFVERV